MHRAAKSVVLMTSVAVGFVCGRSINQSINLLKAKGPNGHLHRSKIHDMQ